MVGVGRDLTDHPVPPPGHGQGPLPPAQGAPSPVQPGLEPCQGGGNHSFSGQPGPGPLHPHSEEFVSNLNLPSFSLKLSLHALVPSPSPALLWTPSGTGSCSKVSFPPSRGVLALGSFLGPPLALLQQLQVCPVLRAPELNAGLPGGLSRAGQRGRIPSLALCPHCWGCSPGHGWPAGLPAHIAG